MDGRPPPKRSLTPHSTRVEIAKGASEIAVDDFVDSFLTERPHTHPPGAASVPPPSEPPPRTTRGLAPPFDDGPPTARTAPPPMDAHTSATVRPGEIRSVSPPFVPAAPPELGTRLQQPGSSTVKMNAVDLQQVKQLPSSRPMADPPVPRPVSNYAKTMALPALPSSQVPPAAPLLAPAPAPLSAELPAQAAQQHAPVAEAAPLGPAAPIESARAPLFAPTGAPPTPAKKSVVGPLLAALAVGAGLALAVFVVLPRFLSTPVEQVEPSVASEPNPAVTTRATSDSPAAIAGTATAIAPASPEPTASVGHAAAPVATGGVASASPAELGKLLSFQAFLIVQSDADAEVVVQGQGAGRTNQRLTVRCGPRNVRLRKDDQTWASAGQHVQINCMQEIRVSIASGD